MISRDNKSFSQWAGPVEDLGEEFDKIDENGGGQVVTIIALLASILTKRGNKCAHICVSHMTILFKSEDDHHTPLVKSRLPISYDPRPPPDPF